MTPEDWPAKSPLPLFKIEQLVTTSVGPKGNVSADASNAVTVNAVCEAGLAMRHPETVTSELLRAMMPKPGFPLGPKGLNPFPKIELAVTVTTRLEPEQEMPLFPLLFTLQFCTATCWRNPIPVEK